MNNQKGFGIVGILVIIVSLGLLFAAGWYVWQRTNTGENDPNSNDTTKVSQPDTSQDPAKDDTYQLSGELLDVTMAKTIRGVQTGGQSSGEAKARFTNDKYEMIATFNNLPDPKDDDFYEGWLVRREPFKFISTGKLTKTDGAYTNRFTANEDLTAYDFYVLTLEPNDGDPAPADHIVKGVMKR